jgi:predicted nucleic acid-binding protein
MSRARSASPNVVDSSGWIEYFIEAPNADVFAPAIEDSQHLIVPSLSILEVFKWVLREHGEDAALKVGALMQQGHVVNLDAALALQAAKFGIQRHLPLADCVIYATAQAHKAVLWTQDADFEGLPGVQYQPKKKI